MNLKYAVWSNSEERWIEKGLLKPTARFDFPSGEYILSYKIGDRRYMTVLFNKDGTVKSVDHV